MGSPDLSISATGATTVLPGSHPSPVIITNTGSQLVFIDDNAGVSSSVYDYALSPGASVSWAAKRSCYATTAPGTISTLAVAINIVQYNPAPSTGGGLIDGNIVEQFRLSDITEDTYFDVGNYTSITIRMERYGVGLPIVPATGEVLIRWSDAPPTIDDTAIFSYSYERWRLSAGAVLDVQITTDVRKRYLSLLNLANLSVIQSLAQITIVGYTQRRPRLAYEESNNNATTTELNYQTFENGILVGSNSAAIDLPLWSGRIRVGARALITGTPTLVPSVLAYTETTNWGLDEAPLTVFTNDSYRAFLDFHPGREPASLLMIRGTGYTSLNFLVNVIFYGNEDS